MNGWKIKKKKLTTKYGQRVRSRVENIVIPAFGTIPIAEIRGRDILPRLREHEARGHIETAHKVARDSEARVLRV